MQRYKLDRDSVGSLERLLHMEYTPTEISREIRCSRHKILSAIHAGCPHRRTPSGRIRIVGDEFRDWYREIVRRRRRPLGPGEAFCLRCRRAVPLPAEDELEVHDLGNGATRVTAQCPICETTVNRFRKAVDS